jgi:hypothetical protein
VVRLRNGLKIEVGAQGMQLFLATDGDGNVIISASGAARIHIDGLPDPVITQAAVNLGTGDYGVRGYLRAPVLLWKSFERSGNINDPPPTAPSRQDSLRCRSMALGLGPMCSP